MQVSERLLGFLKLSQRISNSNLLITDNENSIIEIKTDGTITHESRKISEELKNFKGDKKEDIDEVIKIFEDDNNYYAGQIFTRIHSHGTPIGFLVYYSDKYIYDEKMYEFMATALQFVEREYNE